MEHRETSYFWPIPCGTWFATRVYVSAWVPLLALVICWHLGAEHLRLALAFVGIFFLSLVLHEFGHVVAARMGGGAGEEIVIWPFGGLATVETGHSMRWRLLTPAAGPLVNLILCGLTLTAVVDSGHSAASLHPVQLPLLDLAKEPLTGVLVLVFNANWVLLLLNIVPAYPLDGGQILRLLLSARLGGQTGHEVSVRIGLAAGVVGMFAGLLLNSTAIVFFGAVVLLLNLYMVYQFRASEEYDESFMGYDFSQGYTSLERSQQDRQPQRRPGLLKRWRERRRVEKLRKQQQQDAEVDTQLDQILQKVHTHGMESLTVAERRLLNRASARYRQRGHQSE